MSSKGPVSENFDLEIKSEFHSETNGKRAFLESKIIN
jgi:hypothetical protein